MPSEKQINDRRAINARISALRSVGRDDDYIADSLMKMDFLDEKVKSKIKGAKAAGKTSSAIEGLYKYSSQDTGTPLTTSEDLKTKGVIGGVSDFLGIEKLGRRIGSGAAMLDPQHRRNLESLSEQERETIKTGGVSNKETLGSAGNLALNLVGGGLLLKGAGALKNGRRALDPLIQHPFKTLGASTGLGYASDVANDLEQNKSVGEAVLPGWGTVIGAGLGAIPGARRLLSGAKADKEANKLLQLVAPDLKDITEREYKELLRKGLVNPRTATQPATYRMTDRQTATALRNANLIDKDPARTTMNITQKVAELDSDVGQFLQRNNGIFNSGELKNAIQRGMADISDINIPKERIDETKANMIENFLGTLQTKDTYSLWQARKAFDQKIDAAFSGSPTLQKEMKIAFRNSIQDFIADKTPDKVYKQYMRDMSDLYDIQDLTAQSASKERGYSGFTNWMKDNPRKSNALGWGAAGAGASALGILGINSAFGGRSLDDNN